MVNKDSITIRINKEFNLSKRPMAKWDDGKIKGVLYLDKDVKEFIRLLKDLGFDRGYSMKTKKHYMRVNIEDIEELAGDDLKTTGEDLK